jgi:8-amino-7-oxononanoate synthase
MSDFPLILEQRLQQAEKLGQMRILKPRWGEDFCSNDYLGFSGDEALKAACREELEHVPFGASGSRLIRGELAIFAEAEKELAQFCGRETALIYASGYQANVGLLSALLTSEDLVFSDSLNHASLIDGIRLSGAKKVIYDHGDMTRLRAAMVENRNSNGLKVVVTESVFSMNGDRAPLVAIADLAEEFDALFIVDEAHATGLWGNLCQGQGGGLVQELGLSERVFASTHPAGKAMGMSGAWICGDSRLREYLINFSRSFIYSTAPSPILPAVLRATVQFWKQVGPERVRELTKRMEFFQSYFPSESAIIPIVVGDNRRAVKLSEELLEAGFEVRAIRPPTVPEGRARLRLTLRWNHSWESLEHVARLIKRKLEAQRDDGVSISHGSGSFF